MLTVMWTMNTEETQNTQVGLLVVDLQIAVFQSAKIPPADNAEILLRHAQALLQAARAAGIPIVHVQHCGAPGEVLEEGAPGWPIYSPLSPLAGEAVLQKRTSDSFNGTALHAVLSELGVTSLVVTGIQSERCVAATCRRAIALGYRVLLARDGHSTWPDGSRTAREIIEEQNRDLESSGVELCDVRALVDGSLAVSNACLREQLGLGRTAATITL